MAGKCDLTCEAGNNCCCLECPDREECNAQCPIFDGYEFIEDCPDYIKEGDVGHGDK